MPTQVTANSHPNDKHKRWEESKKDLFLENLNQNKMNDILNTLNDITQRYLAGLVQFSHSCCDRFYC